LLQVLYKLQDHFYDLTCSRLSVQAGILPVILLAYVVLYGLWILLPKRQAFSTTPIRGRDMAKLTLIGNLAKDPEARLTKNEKEYIVYASILLLYNATILFSSPQIYCRYPRSCSSCRRKWRYDNPTVISTTLLMPVRSTRTPIFTFHFPPNNFL